MEVLLGLFIALLWVHARNTRRQSNALATDVRKALDAIEELRGRMARKDAVATPPPPAVIDPTPAAPPPNVPAPAVVPLPAATPDPVRHEPIRVPAAPNPVVQWLLRGNPLAKLGVLLLFFGLAYLLRFATEHGLLPIEVRLTGATVIALALLAVGWRLRVRLPAYALTLQGGAIGALYLTSFAAFRVYSLLPPAVVFALLVVICAASVALAVLQNARSLAVLASLGGYLAPVLLSTGGGNHVALFSYYTLLSIGILSVSVWRAWPPLNVVGFLFTFVVGALWGIDAYTPALYVSCQIFLALNLVIYGVLAVLVAIGPGRAARQPHVDGTLTFGTPLVGFGLQVGLTQHWRYGPAFSALAFGALYLPLAWFVLRRWPKRGRSLTISFLALGAGFVTLAIPLALSARWTSMAWALEGLGMVWAGRTQKRARMSWSGTGLLGLAAASAFVAWSGGVNTPTFLLVGATLSLSWLGGAWLWRRTGSSEGHDLASRVLFGGAILTWLLLVFEGSHRLTTSHGDATVLVLVVMSLSALLWHAAGRALSWRALVEAAFLLTPVAGLVVAAQTVVGQQPFGDFVSSAGWLVAFAAQWHLLRHARHAPPTTRQAALHVLLWWVAFAVIWTDTTARLLGLGWGSTEWRFTGMLGICSAFALGICILRRRSHWAAGMYPRAYLLGALTPAWVLATFLLAAANLLDGRTPRLPYVPLLNPIEESAAFALMVAVLWRRSLDGLVSDAGRRAIGMAIVAGVAWWCNGLLLRTFASVSAVPWTLDALWDSAFIQASMAIAWTTGALVCMAIAARRVSRVTWFVGAAMLGVVVAKLFLVDSANSSGLGRAVAFIGVALLVLLIGYLAPLPPRAQPTEGSAS